MCWTNLTLRHGSRSMQGYVTAGLHRSALTGSILTTRTAIKRTVRITGRARSYVLTAVLNRGSICASHSMDGLLSKPVFPGPINTYISYPTTALPCLLIHGY